MIEKILNYARDVGNKLLLALSAIWYQKTAATEDTATAIKNILDYVATYPNDGIIYCSRNTVLADHADSVFPNESKGCSRAVAHIF